MQNLFNTKEDNYFNPELDEEDNYSDLEYNIIWHNEILDGQDKFPNFHLREASFDRCSHPPHILKSKQVVLWMLSYQHVIITSGVLDRNG